MSFSTDSDLPFGVSVAVSHGAAAQYEGPWLAAAPSRIRSAHPKRRAEWVSARVALAHAFSLHGVALDPMSALFVGHHGIDGLPDWTFSLSHDEVGALAWLAPAKAALSIGVDREPGARAIADAVRKKFTHPQDCAMPPLALWGIKEAAYKALPEDWQEKLWLDGVAVLTNGEFSVEGHGRVGRWIQKQAESAVFSYAFRA